ncbi:MAG TPA: S8 family serine peptidase, partial [Candidatus Thermoplasmatota archaeon]|nr:S8 family serine peptidase [Candidatus Thermoplasmatota archaeon]
APDHSLCPSCRIVSVEGLGAQGVRWAADQGWIDVQTNSWGDLVPGVVPDAVEVDGLALGNAGIRDAFAFAAQRMLVFAASGNGVAFQGGVGEPTLAYATGAAGVLLVGADDNGRVNLYPGTPHHVVADGYGGWHANATSMDAFGPSHEACCTSAASPYAAGGAAAVLLEARRLLGHAGTGWHDGVGARGRVVPGGALDDGRLDLGELHHLLRATASPRPVEGPDDGLVHWLATAKSQDDLPDPLTEPGQNPYCPACWTYPLQWGDVPDDAPAFALVGYGAVDGLSVANAVSILRGQAGLPDRTADDALFEADQLARAAVDALP